jgi:hypothetical protein
MEQMSGSHWAGCWAILSVEKMVVQRAAQMVSSTAVQRALCSMAEMWVCCSKAESTAAQMVLQKAAATAALKVDQREGWMVALTANHWMAEPKAA